MKRIIAACAVLAILLLAGCSSGGGWGPEFVAQQQNSAPETQSGKSETHSDAPDTSYESTPSTVSTPPPPPKPALNVRGNIEKAIGEIAGATSNGGKLFDFVITGITPGFQCSSGYANPPENGQFLAVSMTVTAGPSVAQMGGSMNISGYDFQIIGVDGVAESNVQSVATYSCLDNAQQFPAQGIPQGTTANGTIVLDTKNASGFLVFRPPFMSDAGWEYKF